MRKLSLGFFVLLLGCGSADVGFQPVTGVFVPNQAVLIDLSQPVGPDMPAYGGTPFASVAATPKDGAPRHALALDDRAGTHIEAPALLVPGQITVDRMNTGTLVGAAVVIDVTRQVATDPDYRITARDIARWEDRNGLLPAGAIIVMSSGWSQRWGRQDQTGRDLYLNPDAEGVCHFPGFDPETIRALMLRGIAAVAVDTYSIEGGKEPEPAGHKLLMAAGRYAIENLSGIERLPANGATLFVAPLKVTNGTAAPARVLALAPRP